MRHFLILTCLLFVTATVADEPEFDFDSVAAKKALRDYNKAVAKDKRSQDQKQKTLDEEAAKAAKETHDAFVANLKRALKKSMQAGNLEEANKIDAAIKVAKKGKLKSALRTQVKEKQKTDLLLPQTKTALVKFLMGTSWLLAIEPKIHPGNQPKTMSFLSEDTAQMWWGEKVRWVPVSARTLRIKHRDWTRVVAFSPDFRSFELYVPHENNFVHGYLREAEMNNPPSRR